MICSEIDDERPLWCRVQRKSEIDLIGLQVEHRIAVGRLDVFDGAVELAGDVLRHVDAHPRPLAGREILVEIGRLPGERGDAQHLRALDPVHRRVGGRGLRLGLGGEHGGRPRRGGGPGGTSGEQAA
jgi:hypothetical protein